MGEPGDGTLMLEEANAVELRPGLWRWVVYHPEWKQDVSCAAYAPGRTLVLIDPMAPAEPRAAGRFWRALAQTAGRYGSRVEVLLTIRWHERHAPQVAERLGPGVRVRTWAPAGAVRHLSRAPERTFGAVRPPAGVVALPTARPDEVALWLPRAKTLFAGDALLGGVRRPLRVCPQSWLPRGVRRADLARSLRPVLDLPVELVVPAHGEPVAHDAAGALRGALADAS